MPIEFPAMPARADGPLPTVSDPIVRAHLLFIASLVFAIVVVGGLTRLTESGLSITEWELVTGVLPPLDDEQWTRELDKYRLTPEGRLLNKDITLSEFKRIYLYEYSHRLLGRVIGLAFLLPIPYFAARGKLSRRAGAAYVGIATLIGGQGALGWYMVKSGLDEQLIDDANLSGVPRVSQYRLAAHLGMAFAVYAGCLRLAMSVGRDAKLARSPADAARRLGLAQLATPLAGRARVLVTGMTALVYLTAISGAFVAGLDAGLLYNTFPLMDGRLVPPIGDLFSPAYVRPPAADPSVAALVRRNVFENPTTVQFDHRVLATTTWTSAVALAASLSRSSIASALPRSTLLWTRGIAAMATLQAALGISTLVYLVPTYLAAAHQAGSLVLLSLCIGAGVDGPNSAKKRKATRACLCCQKAHLTCDDARPCGRCIKRGIECTDGLRKRAKYLDGIRDNELGFRPSAESTRAHFQHEHDAEIQARRVQNQSTIVQPMPSAYQPVASTSTAPFPTLFEAPVWQPPTDFGADLAIQEYGFLSSMLDSRDEDGRPTPATTMHPTSSQQAPHVHHHAGSPTSSSSTGSAAHPLRPDEVFNSVVVPFPYARSYGDLLSYLQANFERADIIRVVRAIAFYRPSMIALQAPLSFDDEVFIEKALQRTLIELAKLIEMSGTPTVVWRRTGELLLISDEYVQLTRRSRSELLRGRRRHFMWELIDRPSLVEYYEGFAAHSFENSLQAFTLRCRLLCADGTSIPCASCHAIKRDLFGLPLFVVGQFLPTGEDDDHAALASQMAPVPTEPASVPPGLLAAVQ